MKTKRTRDKFIKELEKIPIVQVACNAVNISRQTYYRWIKEDPDFAKRSAIALDIGNDNVNDVAQGNILRGIQNGDKKDSRFWLTHRCKEFMNTPARRLLRDAPLFSDKDIEAVKRFEDEWLKDGGVSYDKNHNPVMESVNTSPSIKLAEIKIEKLEPLPKINPDDNVFCV